MCVDDTRSPRACLGRADPAGRFTGVGVGVEQVFLLGLGLGVVALFDVDGMARSGSPHATTDEVMRRVRNTMFYAALKRSTAKCSNAKCMIRKTLAACLSCRTLHEAYKSVHLINCIISQPRWTHGLMNSRKQYMRALIKLMM